MTTTAGDLIGRALRKSGVIGTGQTAAAEDLSDALADLNDMLAQWQRKRWLVYHLVDVSKVSTGAQSYSVGAGGDFSVARPDQLEGAFVRQLIPASPTLVDNPLDLIHAREDWNQVRLKTLGTYPQAVFYDSAFPLGQAYFWPVPASGIYELHLSLKEQLQSFATAATAVSLPPEYNAAILWNLAARLRPSYQLPPDPTVTAMARDSLNVIKNANAQIPRLRMPRGIPSRGRVYNILADR